MSQRYVSKENIVAAISTDITAILEGDGEKIVEDAKKIAQHISKSVKMHQLRKIFRELKMIRNFEKDKKRLNMLRPTLAYTAARFGSEMRDFQQILDNIIKKVNSQTHLDNLRDFMEALIAYQRYYEERRG